MLSIGLVAVAIAVLLPALAVLFYAFFSFDQLVRFEYHFHRKSWESDGRPHGFFWIPREASFFQGGWTWSVVSLTWLTATPTWAASNPEVMLTFSRWRMAVLVWNVAIVTVAAMAILSSFL